MIKVQGLTKEYGPKKGVFDLNFTVNKGEVFGFLGPNGAGKTTTIRHLLGFIRPDHGSVSIQNLDCFNNAKTIQESLGYISGETAFFDAMKGVDFLKFIAEMRQITDLSRMMELSSYFELDSSGYIKKMSKGMRQKLAIIAAFMHDPDIYILDEPTSGLDPLMQSKFVELIKKEKQRGKTILMSSHHFDEIERTCDRALIIKHGKQIALKDIHELKNMQRKIYIVTVDHEEDMHKLSTSGLDIIKQNGLSCEIQISGSPNELIDSLSKLSLKSLDVKTLSLEEIFMDYYRETGDFHE